jgi:non-heme chloroperoxidase
MYMDRKRTMNARNTVVMIHGMFGRPVMWHPFIPPFRRKGYDVLTPALPFHDGPADNQPAVLGSIGIGDCAETLRAYLQTLPEPPLLIGHSFGGLLAQMMAAKGLARAIVLLAPVPPLGIATGSPIALLRFKSIFLTPSFWKKPVRPTFTEASRSIFSGESSLQRQRLYNGMMYESGRVFYEVSLGSLLGNRARFVDTTAVDCPVLIVAGGSDPIAGPSVCRRIAYRYRRTATYVEFPGVHHLMLQSAHATDIIRVIMAWTDMK